MIFALPRWLVRTRALKPAPVLDLTIIPWLMITALVTLAPHFEALPIWLPIAATLTLLWRGWMWRKGQLAGHKGIVVLLAIAGTVGILAEYRTIFGREPGVALLVVLMSLKLIELRANRDAIVVVMLGYFLLLTHYFLADSIPVGLWMLFAMTIATSTLIRLQAPQSGTPLDTLRESGKLILQALPIMAILFLLFPRINGPLWGLPQDAKKATTGLSDEIAPGTISSLSQSSALAFRVEFKGAMPARDQMYWRGPVMTDYDGRIWRVRRPNDTESPKIFTSTGAPASSALARDTFEYAMTIEPHQQRWLLALDLPIRIPPDAFFSPLMSVVHKSPLRDRMRAEFTSITSYRVGTDESPNALRAALALPANINPQSRALANQWRTASDKTGIIVAKALQHFQQEPFIYTLNPPLLGRDAIDEFMFVTRRGFCEHYASAFVFLMRAAGVPSRVVAGYQGGEINPVDGHLTVRQLDAHAWAEVWTPETGWQRIDPTAAIAPNRVEQGLQAALPAGDALPTMLRPELDWLREIRYRWDAIDYTWNRWVLGYDEERQRQVLKALGIGDNWKNLIAWMSGIIGIVVLSLTYWLTRRANPHDPAKTLWLIACGQLSRRGYHREPAEGAMEFARRVSREDPDLGAILDRIVRQYLHMRYANKALTRISHGQMADFLNDLNLITPSWKIWSLRFWILLKNLRLS